MNKKKAMPFVVTHVRYEIYEKDNQWCCEIKVFANGAIFCSSFFMEEIKQEDMEFNKNEFIRWLKDSGKIKKEGCPK